MRKKLVTEVSMSLRKSSKSEMSKSVKSNLEMNKSFKHNYASADCSSETDGADKQKKVGKPVGFKHTASWVEYENFISSLNILLDDVDEQKRRQITGLFSMVIGYGGDTRMSEITGLKDDTIHKGRIELLNGLADCPKDRVRKKGGGSKKVEEKNPGIEKALETIVENNVAGDPCSSKKWVRISAEEISKRLKKRGFNVSAKTVRRLLKKRDIHLK